MKLVVGYISPGYVNQTQTSQYQNVIDFANNNVSPDQASPSNSESMIPPTYKEAQNLSTDLGTGESRPAILNNDGYLEPVASPPMSTNPLEINAPTEFPIGRSPDVCFSDPLLAEISSTPCNSGAIGVVNSGVRITPSPPKKRPPLPTTSAPTRTNEVPYQKPTLLRQPNTTDSFPEVINATQPEEQRDENSHNYLDLSMC